jgi:dephospho-CoA kinase
MHIIGFTGMPWSGKSEAVKLAKDQDIPIIRMGDFVWNEVKKRGLSLTSKNVGKIANEMRETHGSIIWAKKTVDTIKRMKDNQLVVIDGIRSTHELSYLRTHLSDSFHLVAITAPDWLRYKRAKKRNREDDSSQDNEMKKRDDREKRWGIEEVIHAADETICNDSTLKSFHKKIHNLFSVECMKESIV